MRHLRLQPFFVATALAVATFVLACSSVASAGKHTHPDYGAIELQVVDADDTQPVSDAFVVLEGEPGDHVTDEEGMLELDELPPREAIVTIDHPDYEPKEAMVEIEAGKLTEFDIHLSTEETTTATDEIVVTTTERQTHVGNVYRPTASLSGDELQRHRGSSVPSTLDAIPGFDVQYNGPGAANPTIRGMPGDRVLMLEDGHGTGDISWTASDHGVMVEPISAERMEVVRGPAGLLYGSNALGGVSNVIRNDVPVESASSIQGRFGTDFESVNNGISSGLVLRGPLGPLTFYSEATVRRTGDTETPLGTIDQTDMRVLNAGLGLSAHPDWGVVGGAVRLYDNVYGVPGEFDGELIPGGHPGGVHIETTRMSARLLTQYERSLAVFDGFELRSSATNYLHDEIEGIVGDEEAIGASFEQFSTDSRLLAYHDPTGDPDDEWSAEGALGLSFQTRHMEAGGAAPGTRSGQEMDIGVFGYEELARTPFRLQAGLRFDYATVATDDTSPLRTNTQERTIEKEVQPHSPRQFPAVSGSLASLWDVTDHWTLGSSVARSIRNPRIEELYSDGPHLADFSYDIGSPDLDRETGLGLDVFLRGEHSDIDVEIAGYYNRVDNYIYYNPTGESVRVHRDGEAPRSIPVFEAQGDDALFVGAEGRVEWNVFDDFTLDATASYTRATRRTEDDPLPAIPPLSGRLEARYDGDPFFAAVGTDIAAPQNRVPRPVQVGDTTTVPEQTTEGYALSNAMLGFRYAGDHFFHTVMVQVENITDSEWRDHMSRIKEVAPQPGRNIHLTYEADF